MVLDEFVAPSFAQSGKSNKDIFSGTDRRYPRCVDRLQFSDFYPEAQRSGCSGYVLVEFIRIREAALQLCRQHGAIETVAVSTDATNVRINLRQLLQFV